MLLGTTWEVDNIIHCLKTFHAVLSCLYVAYPPVFIEGDILRMVVEIISQSVLSEKITQSLQTLASP
jgi:hypothetical protein